MILKEATVDYDRQEFDRACRKYEEALSLWLYYLCHNPKWDSEGIDDDQIELVDDKGKTEKQKELILDMKLTCFLNIAGC
jgi:hypothetical protein